MYLPLKKKKVNYTNFFKCNDNDDAILYEVAILEALIIIIILKLKVAVKKVIIILNYVWTTNCS